MEITFYFDYISHNAYLAWCRLPEIAKRNGCAVIPVPVLFTGFLKRYGQLGPAEIEPKIEWMNRNNLRKAALLGVPFNAPVVHPFNPLLLLRASHAEMLREERLRLMEVLLRGIWVDRLDPRDAAACAAYLDQAGFEGDALIAFAGTFAAKDAVRHATDAAIEAGVFGVPTMVVDDEIFWGYDDLFYLDKFLQGEGRIEPSELEPWRACREGGIKRA